MLVLWNDRQTRLQCWMRSSTMSNSYSSKSKYFTPSYSLFSFIFILEKRCFLVDNFGWQNNLLKLVAEYVTLCHSHGVFCVWTQVLSMSRLGGAPLVADMSSEVHYLLPFSFAFTSNDWNIKTHQHWYHKKGV